MTPDEMLAKAKQMDANTVRRRQKHKLEELVLTVYVTVALCASLVMAIGVIIGWTKITLSLLSRGCL